MSQPVALIFDMDGLLFDTETLYYQATQQVVAPFGLRVPLEIYSTWIGRNIDHEEFRALFPIDLSEAELTRRTVAIFEELCETSLALRPGVAEFLERTAGWPRAIASSSARSVIDRHLNQMGLADEFPVRASARECARGKPAPDVFLAAADGLGADPARCVVFEDSPFGVQGARAAGMRAVAVPTELTAHCDFSLATRRVASLAEIELDWLRDD